ncbi:unnamed protein product [Protopolystoma xenopodis]|uniref:Uncharacterized protein n=1 Tax=Protopolystoma xenopodis TaxID=117903 RepID=A0A3S5ABY4_9PLAT|nr:unnamed protein product [Protopolystoma xenopodis]
MFLLSLSRHSAPSFLSLLFTFSDCLHRRLLCLTDAEICGVNSSGGLHPFSTSISQPTQRFSNSVSSSLPSQDPPSSSKIDQSYPSALPSMSAGLAASAQASATNATAYIGASNVTSASSNLTCGFQAAELRCLGARLRDLMLGLVELAHPEQIAALEIFSRGIPISRYGGQRKLSRLRPRPITDIKQPAVKETTLGGAADVNDEEYWKEEEGEKDGGEWAESDVMAMDLGLEEENVSSNIHDPHNLRAILQRVQQIAEVSETRGVAAAAALGFAATGSGKQGHFGYISRNSSAAVDLRIQLYRWSELFRRMQRLVVQIYDWDRRCRRQLIWISNEDEAVSRQACLSEA